MKILTKEQVLMFHRALIDAHGGSDGIRDDGLLDSAMATPFQTFDGKPLFPTVQQRAVILGFGIVSNHPFIDGNKRTGAHAMLTMLAMNGIMPEYTQKELYEIILKVAAGEADSDDLLEWVLAR
jgi:death-on-curing protein